MSTIFHTGLGDLFSAVRQKLNHSPYVLKEASVGEDDLSVADVFLVGPEETNPIKLVQKINGIDKHISVIVLTFPANFSKVKQTVQFAPFVGNNTLCVAYTEGLDIGMALKNASLRTRQRRSFSRINKAPSAVTSIALSTVKVDHLGLFLEQAPIGALLVDEESRVVAINLKAKQLFNAREQKNYLLQDFFPAFTIQQLKLGFGTTADNSYKVVEVNQQYLELHLSEVENDDGKMLNILLVNDITEQKKKEAALAESEALFRFMAEAMPQKIWTANEKGEVGFFNQHWVAYTGLTMDQLKAGQWTKSIHPDDIGYVLDVWQQAVRMGEEFELEERIRSKEGEYRWHLVRGVPRKDAYGKVLLWVGTNTDIHERKEFASELERRVKERTLELEKSKSELEQFVYVTSHDLQEPLRKIRMFSEMVKDSTAEIDEVSKRYIDKISATALRMTTLLKELLNFTQVSKQEQFEDTDLRQIVSKVLIDLELAISEKGGVIDVGDLPVIKAVPVQMHQLFYNLINNALKFSKPGVPPEIRICAKEADKDTIERYPHLLPDKRYCEILVQDNGIGFDQKYAEQIFHIFQRLHSRTEYSGTGIGLALCKKVVTNHSGTIYAKAEKGEGATFHILLPMEQ